MHSTIVPQHLCKDNVAKYTHIHDVNNTQQGITGIIHIFKHEHSFLAQ